MPVRYQVVAVVVLWLATTGWFVWREFWPHERTGQPPPVGIDLPDEAGKQLIWFVYKDGKNGTKIGQASSGVKYLKADDGYELQSYFSLNYPIGKGVWSAAQLKSMESTYRVTRDGELRGLTGSITLMSLNGEIKAEVKAQVEDGYLVPRWEFVSTKISGKHTGTTTPVRLPERGNVLNPLLLVNRLVGVREGQNWDMPLFDPLRDTMAGFLNTDSGKRWVHAEVKRAPELLQWMGRDTECLVIEYSGEEVSARTWVRARDGLVLCQEATLHGDTLLLDRKPD